MTKHLEPHQHESINGNILAGKYLTFTLGNEGYGIPILKVKEIIGIMRITDLPNLPSYLKGVVNLRDRVIPIMDLRLKFSMHPQDNTERTCIVVVEVMQPTGAILLGLLVDGVSEVVNYTGEEIEAPPALGSDQGGRYILGLAKRNDQVKILLDIDRVVSNEDVISLADAA